MNVFPELCKKLDAGTDQNLHDYFTRTAAIDALALFESRRVLAVGLKGVGKSAAFRYFTEFDADSDMVVGVSPEKYALHLPNKNIHYSACRKQFEHDLAIEALREVTEKRDSLTKKVPKALLDDAARQVKSYTDKVKEYAGRFGGVSVLGCGFTLTKADTPVLVGLRPEKDLRHALDTLAKISASGLRIRIVVDDPEQVFSASRDLDTHLVGGFCLAGLRLSERVPSLKVIVLLKTHVYYPVLRDVDDLRKYPDHKERLSWTKDELLKVVANRLQKANSNFRDFFDGNEKQARAMVESMCAYLRNGPRDLLRWIDLSLQTAKGAKITQTIISQTKKGMSIDSFGELESSHGSEYPRIGAVIKAIFRDDPGRKYSLRELREHILSLLVKDPEMMALYKLSWMQSETSHTLPELLFETGSISLELDKRLILPYEDGYDTENLEAADRICLAPALIEAVK